jgi:hypothetical protein
MSERHIYVLAEKNTLPQKASAKISLSSGAGHIKTSFLVL